MKRTAYINGKIFTSDRENLYAESMITEGGRVAWIGKESQRPCDAEEIIDLKGRCVVPGFVDAHMHPTLLADFSKQIACLPPKVNSLKELAAEIARVREQQGPDQWIMGWGYDEGKLAEHRAPNRYDLDAGASDAPVYLIRSDEHIRCVNSAALKLAGITRDTPDPEGGVVEKDENGEPTGILKENAKYLIAPYLPEETLEGAKQNLLDLGELLSSQGVVAVGDMGNLTSSRDNYPLYKDAAAAGFRQRVAVYYMWDFYENDPAFAIPAGRTDGREQIHAAGLKLIGDGTPSGRTAWSYEPFLGSEDYGMPIYTDESFQSALDFVKANHLQLSVHAMGARAIDRIADRIAEEPHWMDDPDVPDIRIEHITEPTESALDKCRDRGIAIVSQPIFGFCEVETYLDNMGAERFKKAYPFRHMREKGCRLAFSTDSPATSWVVPSDPFPNLKAAVTRYAYDGTDMGQDQKLDMETAIILYTKEAAEVCGFKGLGMLKSGYDASFVVLGEDIFNADPEKLDAGMIDEVYIGGSVAYMRKV